MIYCVEDDTGIRELLRLFLENPGQVFTRDRLLERVRGTDYFGEPRTVDVHIGTLRTWEENGEGCLSVKDTGIGIPEEDHGRIFERFYRVDKSRSKEVGGTGLGLGIVKHAVQTLGGRIELQSTPGRGTTVTVRFKMVQ